MSSTCNRSNVTVFKDGPDNMLLYILTCKISEHSIIKFRDKIINALQLSKLNIYTKLSMPLVVNFSSKDYSDLRNDMETFNRETFYSIQQYMYIATIKQASRLPHVSAKPLHINHDIRQLQNYMHQYWCLQTASMLKISP